MRLKFSFVPYLVICVSVLAASDHQEHCNQTCRGDGVETRVSFPFGFSPSCGIQLNCSSNGVMRIDDFGIQSLTSRSIVIDLPPKCNRPILSIQKLFTRNYAPISRNVILLQNCTSPVSFFACVLPQTNFEMIDCNSSFRSNTSCYLESTERDFVDMKSFTGIGCGFWYSSVSVGLAQPVAVSVELEVGVLELAWWLEGDCRCSPDADCTELLSPPIAGKGFRCHCKEGFEGDGYADGRGCSKGECDSQFIECFWRRSTGIFVGAGAFLALFLGGGISCWLGVRRKERRPVITNCNIPVYSHREIRKATDNFSEKRRLGTGAFGTVYSGKLRGGAWVAVKRIRCVDAGSVEQVVNEVKLLSSVRHRNLLRLLGCSFEKQDDQILVYEFMPNGTLSCHLRRSRGDGLPWSVRLSIAADTASAVAHLHASTPPIYHRDIKSSNILLDFEFNSKVADFGLSRIGGAERSHVSTAPQGTPGYLDPQYHQNFQLSDKSDVYSFGVVLAEILTAMKAVDFSRPEVSLAALLAERIRCGRLEEVIDPFIQIHGDAWTLWSVQRVAEVAFRCIAFYQETRPSMAEVAAELDQIRLSKCAAVEYNVFAASPESSSLSSDGNERPLSVVISRKLSAVDGVESPPPRHTGRKQKSASPVSVQDPWASGMSSPSTSSLLLNSTVHPGEL